MVKMYSKCLLSLTSGFIYLGRRAMSIGSFASFEEQSLLNKQKGIGNLHPVAFQLCEMEHRKSSTIRSTIAITQSPRGYRSFSTMADPTQHTDEEVRRRKIGDMRQIRLWLCFLTTSHQYRWAKKKKESGRKQVQPTKGSIAYY